MPKFIKTDRVAVCEFPDLSPNDPKQNTVWVRRKMNMGNALRIQEALGKGESLVMLYVQNILGWEGPDFKGIKCIPENIECLDYDDPFWVKVGDKIAELNPNLRGETEPNPLASTTDGAAATTESPPVSSESTT